jgi:hypothetical protein
MITDLNTAMLLQLHILPAWVLPPWVWTGCWRDRALTCSSLHCGALCTISL